MNALVKHNIVKYIANQREEQEQIRQRIKRQQELIQNNRAEQSRSFEEHNIARKQHQKRVQEEHLTIRNDKRKQEEERQKQEEERQKQEEERQKQQEQMQRQEEERQKQEEERQKQEEKRQEEYRQRQEEQEKRQEEQRQKEQEQRQKQEEQRQQEQMQKQEEQRQRQEEQRKRQEEQKQRQKEHMQKQRQQEQQQKKRQQEQEQEQMQQQEQEKVVVFDKTKHYYVCSYGGCGSKMLVEYLSHFGNVYHIHSRHPPEKLQYIGNKNNHHTHINQYEWFNDKEIPEDQLSNYTVFYIYRNPISAIYSRFLSTAHLQNIQCQNINLQIQDIIDSSSDLYGIDEFFDNYMNPVASRNYTIYGIKYDKLFENMSQFNTFFNLPDDPKIYPVKNERDRKKSTHHYLLEIIYGNLIRKMDTYDFITSYRSKI